MKTLLLMRHAKSSWKDDSLPDHDRPLKKRGRKDAKRIARVMLKNDLTPDLMISSSATRARQTVEIVAEELGYQDSILYLDELYLAEPQDFIHALSSLDSNPEKVLIVAHNPGLEAYLQIINGEIGSVPTAALGYLVIAIENWKDLSLETMGDLIGIWNPKELKEKE